MRHTPRGDGLIRLRRPWLRSTLAAVLCALAAIAIAACGSSSNSSNASSSSSSAGGSSNSSTSGASAPASTSTTASGSPIKLGFLVSTTGTDSQYPDGLAAAKAAVKGIDARGGIDGHSVVLDSCDVQSNVNIAEQCARKFVSDKDFAVVPFITNYGPQVTPILAAARVPMVGDISPDSPVQFNSPYEFLLNAGTEGTFDASVAYGKIAGFKTYTGVGVQIPIVAALMGSTQKAVETSGGQWKGFIGMPASVTQFAPYVASAQQKHADLAILAMTGPNVAEVSSAANSAGYAFHTFVTAIAYPPSTISTLQPNSAFAKQILFAADLPPVSATKQFPILKTYESDMNAEQATGDKYAGPDWRSPASEWAWYGIHAVQVIGNMIKGGDVTTTTMLQALRSAKNVKLGLTPAWTPDASGPKGFSRVTNFDEYMEKLQNGQLVLAYNKPFSVEKVMVPTS
jgi:ABC-type branched-subunit amino acid transport system substrate-binding protein